MKGFVCKICKYISINGTAPDKCPVCGAPRTAFDEDENAIKTVKDENNATELEKKHTPVITIVKTCGVISEACRDVHARIGIIQHPMQSEHYIRHIDFYLDKEFVSRVMLTPEILNPAASLHFKAEKGKITVIDLCNLHGAWIKEIEL